jgi:hypothetical protein
MDYVSELVANLREEIVYLKGLNAQYQKRHEHSAVERLKYEQWQARLQQIRQELLTLREVPPEPTVWWDRSRRSRGA